MVKGVFKNAIIDSNAITQRSSLGKWMFTPQKTSDLQSALKRLGVGARPGLYISIIDSQAERADIEDYRQRSEIDPYGPILDALNAFLRSLRRSTLSSGKIGKKLSSLPEPVIPFIRLELSHRFDRKFNLENEDWSKTELRDALEHAVRHVRLWFRKNPGPREAGDLAGFSRSVVLLYVQITGKEPGLGGDPYETGYMTPFEELWLASLRLVITDATLDGAREIYRTASGRRRAGLPSI